MHQMMKNRFSVQTHRSMSIYVHVFTVYDGLVAMRRINISLHNNHFQHHFVAHTFDTLITRSPLSSTLLCEASTRLTRMLNIESYIQCYYRGETKSGAVI